MTWLLDTILFQSLVLAAVALMFAARTARWPRLHRLSAENLDWFSHRRFSQRPFRYI